jgi:predicted GIY-YIG superfamily endonuclease
VFFSTNTIQLKASSRNTSAIVSCIYEGYQDVHVAIAREKQIKRWRREKKIALIERLNPRWEDLAETWGRETRFRGQPLG